MKKFRVAYTETGKHSVIVSAASETRAEKKFWELTDTGRLPPRKCVSGEIRIGEVQEVRA